MNTSPQVGTFSNVYFSSIDAVKGLLVLIVIMDHNDLLRAWVPEFFKPLTFHVLGFLILPFLAPVKFLSQRQLFDRAIRYLVPFWCVLTFTTALYTVLLRHDAPANVVLIDWLAALLIGSAPLVKTASGFYYLWFLPALFGVVYVLSIFDTVGRRSKTIITTAARLTHAFIAMFSIELLKYTPFGVLIVLWIFPFGVLMRIALKSESFYRYRYAVLGAFIVSYGYLVFRGKNIEIMTLELHSVTDPLLFILQDISAFTGVVVAIWLAMKLNTVRFINACGKHSLMVYLLHPLIFFCGMKVLGASTWNLESYALALTAILSVVITAGIALLVAILISRLHFTRTWITPKDWNGWGPVRLAARCFHRK